MTESTLSRTVSGVLAFSLVAAVAFISWIAPPTGDIWGYLVAAEGQSPLDLAQRYLHGYFTNNPRIGQYMLALAGYGPLATAAVNVSSLALLLAGGFTLASGRLPKLLRLDHTFAMLIMFSAICAAGTEVGQALFYVPYTTNYVFGFGLLVSFLAIVRVGSTAETSWSTIAAVVILGLLAGLSNEHTPPVVLGLGLAAILVHITTLVDLHLKPIHYVAFVSLLIGYLALYFAPGQAVRYSSIDKSAGFEELLTNLPGRIRQVSELLFANSAEYYLLAVLLAIAAIALAWQRSELQRILWPVLVLVISLGIAATVTASPLVGQRLLFASYAGLGISITSLALYFRRVPILFWLGGIAATAYCGIYLGQASLVYVDFRESYNGHLEEIASAQDSGATRPTFSPYKFDFSANKEFVRPEYFSTDPNYRLNRHRAEIYGFESFSFTSSR